MDIITIFTITSSIAGVCMAICQVPQAVSVMRTHNTDGLSVWMQLLLTSGLAFWFISGILLSFIDFKGGLPMLLSNGFSMIFSFYILIVCIRNNQRNDKQKQ